MGENMEHYNKHYIRTDDTGCIIDGWSDGPLWDKPTDGAICINDKGGYQFRFWPGGVENPTLMEDHGVPLYRWDGEQVVPRTAEEIAADIAALPPPEMDITPEQEQLAALMLQQAQAEAEQQRFNADIMLAVAMIKEGGEAIV